MTIGIASLVDGSNTASGTTLATSAALSVTAGDRIYVECTFDGSAQTFTPTDGGNTYTALGTAANYAGGGSVSQWYEATAATTASLTIQFVLPVAQTFRAIAAFNVPQATGASQLTHVYLTAPGANPSQSVTPATQPGLVIGLTYQSSGAAGTAAATGGFTNNGTLTNRNSAFGSISRVESLRVTSTAAQATSYAVSATGSDFYSAAIFVAEAAPSAPTITVQPTNQSALIGQTATFSVTATGATSYQWNLAGSPISGATSSSYTTGTLTAANNGTVYSVDCTNTNGTTTSASVYLFIIGESSADGDKINSSWFFR